MRPWTEQERSMKPDEMGTKKLSCGFMDRLTQAKDLKIEYSLKQSHHRRVI